VSGDVVTVRLEPRHALDGQRDDGVADAHEQAGDRCAGEVSPGTRVRASSCVPDVAR
jgi:hypothetical protein